MQHVEIPNIMTSITENAYEETNPERILRKGDKVVYAAIRRNMDSVTRSCYPSIHTIKRLAGCGQAKVQQAIERLKQAGLLTIGMHTTAAGRRCNLYKFPITEFDKNFERFTFEFLDLDLPTNVKEYYMDIQHYLYDMENGVGKCNFSNAEIARRTGWSIPSVKKNNTILIERGLLTEETLEEKDQAGLPIVQKQFDLTGLQQAVLWVKAVTEQVTKNTDDIELLKQELEELKQWKAKKEKEESFLRNATPKEIAIPLA